MQCPALPQPALAVPCNAPSLKCNALPCPEGADPYATMPCPASRLTATMTRSQSAQYVACPWGAPISVLGLQAPHSPTGPHQGIGVGWMRVHSPYASPGSALRHPDLAVGLSGRGGYQTQGCRPPLTPFQTDYQTFYIHMHDHVHPWSWPGALGPYAKQSVENQAVASIAVCRVCVCSGRVGGGGLAQGLGKAHDEIGIGLDLSSIAISAMGKRKDALIALHKEGGGEAGL